MKNLSTIILGAGPAGLGAACSLSNGKHSFAVFEKEGSPGGLMRSYKEDGFTFDYAGHIFFSRLPHITELFLNVLQDNVHEVKRHSVVHIFDKLVNFPFQANLKNLPYPVLKECLLSFIYNRFEQNKKEPENFREWIYYAYGKGIADTFMIPYNEKLWTYDLRDISMDWIKDRIAHPEFEEVIEGALQGNNLSLGQNATFYYPLKGGMYSFIEKFTRPFSDSLFLEEKVLKINPKERTVTTTKGDYSFKRLITTLPLPELCHIIDMPQYLSDMVSQLLHVSVYCVNIGARRNIDIPYHWYYFPEKKYIFHRIFVQHNASPYTVPEEHNAFTAEMSYSREKPLDRERAIDMTINGLVDAKLLKDRQDVCHVRSIDIPYGYVVYNQKRQEIVQKLKEYLGQFEICLLGRYGTWEYYNMDHALNDGLHMGKTILSGKGIHNL